MRINNQKARRPWGRLLLAGIFLTGPSLVLAADEIEIDRANWSSYRDRLTVRGEHAPKNATVTIRYGKKGNNGAVIGTAQADDEGDWKLRVTGPSPVPCNVTAQAGGDEDDKSVRRAPNDCSDEVDGAVNQPPTANANGPYAGTLGESIGFVKVQSFLGQLA